LYYLLFIWELYWWDEIWVTTLVLINADIDNYQNLDYSISSSRLVQLFPVYDILDIIGIVYLEVKIMI
jgi:hypothetical protein